MLMPNRFSDVRSRQCPPRSRRRRGWHVIVAAASLSLLCIGARGASADTLTTSGLEYPGVQISEIRDGRIYFQINGRDAQPIALEQVVRINATDEPALNAAEQALAAGGTDTAAEAYQRAITTSGKDWVRQWSARRLADVARQTGRIDQATAAYIEMVRENPSGVLASRPSVTPGATQYLDAAARQIDAALQDRAFSDAPRRQALLAFLLDL